MSLALLISYYHNAHFSFAQIGYLTIQELSFKSPIDLIQSKDYTYYYHDSPYYEHEHIHESYYPHPSTSISGLPDFDHTTN